MNVRYFQRPGSAPVAGKSIFAVIAGLLVGIGIMYLFDPNLGNRRRALVRDKAKHYSRVASRELRRRAHHGMGRARGMMAEARAAVRHEEISDALLHERVRSALGRAVSHPHSIQVQVRDCIVSLSGPILADEVDDLIERVWDVRGVEDVIDNLQVHEHPGTIPGLQRG